MKKLIALLLLISLAAFTDTYADWGSIYYFKSKVYLKDTVLNGYFTAGHQYLPDSIQEAFLKSDDFFKKEVIANLNKSYVTEIWLHDFVYVHYLFPSHTADNALFVSQNKSIIQLSDITKMELEKIIPFLIVPYSIISSHEEADTTWLKNDPIRQIENREIDECCPEQYLIFDESTDYEKLLNQILNLNEYTEERKRLLLQLGKYKVLALRLCWCG